MAKTNVLRSPRTNQTGSSSSDEMIPTCGNQLSKALVNDKNTGVLQRLQKPQPPAGGKATAGLAALWETLLPPAQRTRLLEGKCRRLIVIADGPLAQLPFETLVTRPGATPQYLLDAQMPVEYAPSETILTNLATRAEARGGTRAVLTVGDSRYGAAAGGGDTPLAELASPTRYRHLRGSLAPLPYTAWESDWVGDVFGKIGLDVTQLRGDDATEAKVRGQSAGRKIVHLACHGLVDQAYGNLFGALMFTPGSQAGVDPSDDGCLTLAEIYQLNLQRCELAVLSACNTNFGPAQRGEGVAALSRGFLVAGARRVVASNWLVDDDAAASLVSYFCGGLAQAEKQGDRVDYAAALRDAKQWIREQEKWRDPYYWGSFVLVGPH